MAGTLGLSIIETRAFLERETIKCLVYADDQGRVLSFGGLAAMAMRHRFEVDGRVLSTWCAWDSLFIPEILGRPARVSSVDPESGEIIRLDITPERIESVEPNGTLISFIRPDAHIFGRSAANVMAKFCHFIFFFASRSSGERWVDKNPGTFLYSLEDAFALAKRFNANNFGFVESRSSRSAREMLDWDWVALRLVSMGANSCFWHIPAISRRFTKPTVYYPMYGPAVRCRGRLGGQDQCRSKPRPTSNSYAEGRCSRRA